MQKTELTFVFSHYLHSHILYGITVNVVSPGPIQTGYISPEGEKAIITEIPLRRVGKPEDIANAVLFFASEQANWITGQLLFVHGEHRMALGQ